MRLGHRQSRLLLMVVLHLFPGMRDQLSEFKNVFGGGAGINSLINPQIRAFTNLSKALTFPSVSLLNPFRSFVLWK